MEKRVISWLHLSDIHFGQGDRQYAYDQRLVLGDLTADIRGLIRQGRVPRPDFVFVTGDIAFSGAERNMAGKDEYELAAESFAEIAAAAGIDLDKFFLIPGNHDVQRCEPDAPWFSPLVQCGASIANVTLEQQQRLFDRFRRFREFALKINECCASLDWNRSFVKAGFRINIVGWNTAWLCNGEDRGKLQVRPEEIANLRHPNAGELVILLTHHPFSDGWLMDQEATEAATRGKVHLHFSGHAHKASYSHISMADGSNVLNIKAGAVHNEAVPDHRVDGIPLCKLIQPDHCYSFGQLVVSSDGSVSAEIFPRRWHSGVRGRFRWDVANLPDHELVARYHMKAALSTGPKAKPVTILEHLTGEVSHHQRVAFRDSVFSHLFDQLPVLATVNRVLTFFYFNRPDANGVMKSVKLQFVCFTRANANPAIFRGRAVNSNHGMDPPKRRVYLLKAGSFEPIEHAEEWGECYRAVISSDDKLCFAATYSSTEEEQILYGSQGAVRRDWFCVELNDLASEDPIDAVFGIASASDEVTFHSIHQFYLSNATPRFERIEPSPADLHQCAGDIPALAAPVCRRASRDMPGFEAEFSALGLTLKQSQLWTTHRRIDQRYDVAYVVQFQPRAE